MLRRVLRILVTGLSIFAVFSVASLAAAAELDYGLSVSPIPNINSPVGSIPFFNPSFGTLTGVTLEIQGAFPGDTNQFANESAQTTLFSATWNVNVGVQDTLFLTCGFAGATDLFGPVFLGPGNPPFTFGPPSSAFAPAGIFSNSVQLQNALISQYVGTGNFSVFASGFSALNEQTDPQAGISSARIAFAPQSGLQVTYAYTYTPVPEPVGLSLIGFAAIALTRKFGRR